MWKTLKHITLAYELPSDSRTMRNITLEEGAEEACKVIERLKDDLPNIHTVADCIKLSTENASANTQHSRPVGQ